MSDRKKKPIPADSSRVNVYEQHEVEFWTKKWNCTAAELRAAVDATNSVRAERIEAYLKSRGKLAP
jgi:hypothetical protein